MIAWFWLAFAIALGQRERERERELLDLCVCLCVVSVNIYPQIANPSGTLCVSLCVFSLCCTYPINQVEVLVVVGGRCKERNDLV